MSESYPRDMIGYGAEPPQARWPGEAQIALQFVINYEEGAENAIFHGDSAAESFLSEWIGAQPTLGMRNMNMESLYEYGSRAGFWRLYRAFTSRRLPITIYAVAMALERNPPAVAAMVEAGWEMATHGYRWIDYQYVAESVEREHIAKAIEIHTRATGSRPLGWYQGRCSPNTCRLVAEEGGFVYNADSYADDLPYWDTSTGKPQLIVPYAFDSNDMRFRSESVEREHIAKAIEIHTRATGSRPLGWYQGRCSPNTCRLVAEEGGFVYNADSYADDLPYWDTSTGKPQLIVPYAFDSNDMRF